ncbi:MAG: hypothetical protein U5L45_24315 [Saprospiraceae bacterium]|nr:hypothetical protein [Saprospiraceae bacterium]
MKKIVYIIYLTFFAISTCVFSQESTSPVITKFLVEGGIEYGGDEILKVLFTNGGDQTMRAGQGAYLAVGGQFEFVKLKSLMIRTSLGIKYNTTAADNANIMLTRLPFVVMPFFRIKDDFRIGVGVTSHQRIKLKGDSFFSDVEYKSTVGPRIEFGYKCIALTYTAISYEDKNDKSYSANSLGLSLSYGLSNKAKSKK